MLQLDARNIYLTIKPFCGGCNKRLNYIVSHYTKQLNTKMRIVFMELFSFPVFRQKRYERWNSVSKGVDNFKN